MNRRELNDKLERFADWALDSLRNRDHTWIIVLILGLLLVAIVKFWL